jgi:ketosteroid isomerase-like protein
MSRENVEMTRGGLEAYNRRDVEELLEDLDPEVEWHPALPKLLGGDATVYRGHEGVREFFRDTDDVLDEIHVEYSEIRDLGDRVLVIGHLHARGKASAAETDSPVATVSDVRDGKVIRIQTYLDPKEAFEAAALAE